MKVLMINSVCGIKSTGKICTDIADALCKEGHAVKIGYGREFVPEKYQKYAVRIGSNFDVKMHALKSRFFDRAGFYSKRSTKKFIKWVKGFDPDVIHLHNIHGYYINIKILFEYLRTCGKKIIWTLHDCWAFTGHCAYFDFVGCDKWTSVCDCCPQKSSYPSSIVLDNSKKNFKDKKKLFCGIPNLTIVTPSNWLKELVKKSFLQEYDVKVIKNGIDVDIFKRTPSDFKKKYGVEDKKIILGVASVWDRRKGLEDFIKLSKAVSDDYKIVLVGVSDSQKAQLPENIIGIQKTFDATELAGIYTASDVLFNPTYEDNYPTVNLEAQACGTPVITYDTGGSVESVPEDNVVKKGDIDGFLEKIKLALPLKTENLDKNELTELYLQLY